VERILKVIVRIVTGLACSSTKAESGSVVGSVDLGMGGGNKGLSVTVRKGLGTLTSKSRGEGGVNGHLVIDGPLRTG